MANLYDSAATHRFSGPISTMKVSGALASQMLIENENESDRVFHKYNDPMDIMVRTLHELGFRAAVRAGRDNASTTAAQQTVPYRGYNTHTIYQTNKTFMNAAAAVSVLSLIFVAVTFWGWWELGRDMSLNPLEVAKAFGAPLLAGVGSNVSVKKMPKEVLNTRIRYGELTNNGIGQGKLGICPDAGCPQPRKSYN